MDRKAPEAVTFHTLLTKRQKAFTYALIECGVTPRSMIPTANPNLRSRKVSAFKTNMFPCLPILLFPGESVDLHNCVINCKCKFVTVLNSTARHEHLVWRFTSTHS